MCSQHILGLYPIEVHVVMLMDKGTGIDYRVDSQYTLAMV